MHPGDDISTVMRVPAGATVARSFVAHVAEGPDAGSSIAIGEASRVLIGQSPACDLVLHDPQVSRRHLALESTGDRLRLIDLDSTNGTFVNGVRVAMAWLMGGEHVALGDTRLVVDAAMHSDPTPVSQARSFGRFVGESERLRRIYPICERLAASDVPIVIEGETGTGKEVMAEALHEGSRRAAGPFVVFDCTAVPPNLVESELFGHERGAFTGAIAQRKGVFEQAHGGTLLIDEIGDLDVSLQPKLLRALERSEVRRVGGNQWMRVDVRILSATRRDLDHAVQDGQFRDDLFFRLAVGRIELPPLRDRREDIAVLARHFFHDLGGAKEGERELPYEVLQRFERHTWPGNVRELRNAVARHIAMGASGFELPMGPTSSGTDPLESILGMNLPFPRARQLAQAEFERRYVERVLAESGGNVARAAAASGIARRYFNIILARRRT